MVGASSLSEAGPAREGSPHPRWTLVATILASSLAFIDGSVVNIALPAIGRTLNAGPAELQWTINAYLLPLSALLLIGGAAGDHFGRRRLLMIGIALFTAASIACAIAPSAGVLLAARALQGVGAALLMPNSLAILGDAFSGEERGRAIGTWAAVGAIAMAIGPPLGGWLIQTVGWRGIFLLNVPIALAASVIAWRYVRESSAGARPLDWIGATLATFALLALTWSLTIWSAGHSVSMAVWLSAAAGLLLLTGFLLVERRLADRAMMPLDMFASRPFVGLTLLTFLLYGALGGNLVLLPYVLMTAGGYTPLQAGLVLLPFPFIVGPSSRYMGRLAERIGPRMPLALGALTTGAGFAILGFLDPSASYWVSAFPGMVVIALGMAGAVAPLTTAVLSSVDSEHTGTASGFNSAISRTGGLIATALAGAVMARSGGDMVSAFHVAAFIGAGLAAGSAAVAFAMLDRSGGHPR